MPIIIKQLDSTITIFYLFSSFAVQSQTECISVYLIYYMFSAVEVEQFWADLDLGGLEIGCWGTCGFVFGEE